MSPKRRPHVFCYSVLRNSQRVITLVSSDCYVEDCLPLLPNLTCIFIINNISRVYKTLILGRYLGKEFSSFCVALKRTDILHQYRSKTT